MVGEQPQPAAENKPADLNEEALKTVKEALGSLLISRDPEKKPLTEQEIGTIVTLVGVAEAAGFHKGRWLANAEHESRRLQGIRLPDGYPT
jgi:hypothetical protein